MGILGSYSSWGEESPKINVKSAPSLLTITKGGNISGGLGRRTVACSGAVGSYVAVKEQVPQRKNAKYTTGMLLFSKRMKKVNITCIFLS